MACGGVFAKAVMQNRFVRSIPSSQITRLPEFNVAVFALLLNYPWEFLQVPLFEGMPQAEHWVAIKTCTTATIGDALIMLTAYWAVALGTRSRSWMMNASAPRTVMFASVGIVITVVIERLALSGWWLGGWKYAPSMPVVPGLEVGLSPLLQWVVLPPLVLWFTRRQILGSSI